MLLIFFCFFSAQYLVYIINNQHFVSVYLHQSKKQYVELERTLVKNTHVNIKYQNRQIFYMNGFNSGPFHLHFFTFLVILQFLHFYVFK
jgi:hypothetical protein